MLKGLGLIALLLSLEGAFLLHVALPSGIPGRVPAGDESGALVLRRPVRAVNASMTMEPSPASRDGEHRLEPCKPSS
jgi:hypothetical protein